MSFSFDQENNDKLLALTLPHKSSNILILKHKLRVAFFEQKKKCIEQGLSSEAGAVALATDTFAGKNLIEFGTTCRN